ncbi:MAG TPA: hypothetical protein VFO38_01495 [Candidatus Saccharimonadales bacterium]|nr:hypothetical protein [Candidatus Saccharimonadales bacterium]
MTVTVVEGTFDEISGLRLRGPFYIEAEAAAARQLHSMVTDEVIASRPGGLHLHHILGAMKSVAPELPQERLFAIVAEYVRRRRERLALTDAALLPARSQPADADYVRAALLRLDVTRQEAVLVHFEMLRHNQRIEGSVHPLAQMLYALQPRVVLEIILDMKEQLKKRQATS